MKQVGTFTNYILGMGELQILRDFLNGRGFCVGDLWRASLDSYNVSDGPDGCGQLCAAPDGRVGMNVLTGSRLHDAVLRYDEQMSCREVA